MTQHAAWEQSPRSPLPGRCSPRAGQLSTDWTLAAAARSTERWLRAAWETGYKQYGLSSRYTRQHFLVTIILRFSTLDNLIPYLLPRYYSSLYFMKNSWIVAGQDQHPVNAIIIYFQYAFAPFSCAGFGCLRRNKTNHSFIPPTVQHHSTRAKLLN